ncbi:hypothetical protein GpartN1_g1293.t1 [Galdieria partita]|uniref:RING-type domain-containing protein n=1 Tax=Galdieria partita TaxID=83374 RepID=A0A9C7UNM4_9RHOD|nr:hypothetical protein GpartN1_g1293.t1 [Galdieria partita]
MVNSFLANEGGWIIAGVAVVVVFMIVLLSRQCRRGPLTNEPATNGDIHTSNNPSKPKQSYQKFLIDLDKIAPEVVYQLEMKPPFIEGNSTKETISKDKSELSDLNLYPLYSNSGHLVIFDEKRETNPCDSYQSNDRTEIGNIIHKQPDCSICLESFCIGERLRVLPCLHCFHSCCIILWLMRRSLCPLCKSDVWKPDNGQFSSEIC